jgi:hypothetical protein
MEELLSRHKIFKDYKIIIATGDGEGSSEEALQAIKAAINLLAGVVPLPIAISERQKSRMLDFRF